MSKTEESTSVTILSEPEQTTSIAVTPPAHRELQSLGWGVKFSRHEDDGTLRLYKPHTILGDTPAGYSDEKVGIKILVKTHREEFMVVVNTTRQELDQPGAEERLVQTALAWVKQR